MNDERKVWENYTKGVIPAAREKPRQRVERQDVEKSAVRKAAEKIPLKMPLPRTDSKLATTVTNVLERKREKALREGSLEIEAKLDLHGMTQIQAFSALAEFMHKKAKAGKRNLLIITGKGREGVGVLRNNLQQWLGQLPEAKDVLALRTAATRHGGSGAFYVILRKK